MPRAEAGSTKAISNKIKSRGLTRLRWYCQPCEKACRDENGFKCHVQSESHVRQMLLIGENSKAAIDKYSSEFQREFVELLRTTHGEKKVHVNHFYQQVISNKSHTHMNATKWSSLTQFAAHLGREGIARVEETEKGLFISWIDNRPETLKKREAVLRKERQDKGDEEREQRLIREQVERARKAEMAKAAAAAAADKSEGGSGEESEEKGILERKEGEKVKLSFGAKSATQSPPVDEKPEEAAAVAAPAKTAISFSASSTKPKNIFATKPSGVKPSNAFATVKKSAFVPQQQKVSQQEMIMRREMEAMEQKKRKFTGSVAGGNVFDAGKKQRVS